MEPKFPYRRVADDLRDKIKSGELTGQLPTRAKLAEEYGVADMTIGRALDVLKDEGLVFGVAGLGVFVAERLCGLSYGALGVRFWGAMCSGSRQPDEVHGVTSARSLPSSDL